MPLLGRTAPLVGVDISTTAVKLLELRRDRSDLRVESYAVEPLPTGAVVEKSISDVEAVAEALRRAHKRSGSKAKRVAAAVPASAAISKIMSLPADLREDELEAQVNRQAGEYVPYPLEEVNLDFQVLGPERERPGQARVLLVASRSENVETRVDAIDAAGLTPAVMDVDCYAVENACALLRGDSGAAGGEAEAPGQGVHAVADVGATMTTLTVISPGEGVLYTREQSFGGRQLTEEIMRRYDLSFDEAGRAKRRGGLPEGYEEEVLAPFRDALAQQVARSLQFFYAAGDHHAVDQLWLAGGCAALRGAAEAVEAATRVPTHVADPFRATSANRRIPADALLQDAPALVVAAGLAMRAFDV